MKHRRLHPTYVEGCQKCKWRSISVAASSTPSRGNGARAAEIIATEKRWDTDGDAYKRLRAQGLQPKAIDGSADLEAKAELRFEVESGRIYTAAERPRLVEALAAQAEVKEMGAGEA